MANLDSKKSSKDRDPLGFQKLPEKLNSRLHEFDAMIARGDAIIDIGNPATSEDDLAFLELLLRERKLPKGMSLSLISQNRSDAVSILTNDYGFVLPKKMQSEINNTVRNVLNAQGEVASPEMVYKVFESNFLLESESFSIPAVHFEQKNGITAKVTLSYNGEIYDISAEGNGRLDAVSNAIKQFLDVSYTLRVYEEHALSDSSAALAASYVGIVADDQYYWGVGMDSDIIKASILALSVAIGHLLIFVKPAAGKDLRMVSILNYIQNHYDSVDLDDLVDNFHLSKQYLSKFIKLSTGKNFTDIVADIRLDKACDLLRRTNQTVEMIAQSVGYPTVEHFNRLFKKRLGMTPVQYRNQ